MSVHMPAVDMIGYHNLLPYPLKMLNNGHTGKSLYTERNYLMY